MEWTQYFVFPYSVHCLCHGNIHLCPGNIHLCPGNFHVFPGTFMFFLAIFMFVLAISSQVSVCPPAVTGPSLAGRSCHWLAPAITQMPRSSTDFCQGPSWISNHLQSFHVAINGTTLTKWHKDRLALVQKLGAICLVLWISEEQLHRDILFQWYLRIVLRGLATEIVQILIHLPPLIKTN